MKTGEMPTSQFIGKRKVGALQYEKRVFCWHTHWPMIYTSIYLYHNRTNLSIYLYRLQWSRHIVYICIHAVVRLRHMEYITERALWTLAIYFYLALMLDLTYYSVIYRYTFTFTTKYYTGHNITGTKKLIIYERTKQNLITIRNNLNKHQYYSVLNIFKLTTWVFFWKSVLYTTVYLIFQLKINSCLIHNLNFQLLLHMNHIRKNSTYIFKQKIITNNKKKLSMYKNTTFTTKYFTGHKIMRTRKLIIYERIKEN